MSWDPVAIIIILALALFFVVLYYWLRQIKVLLQENRERSYEVIEEKLKRETEYVESRKEDIKELVNKIEQQLQSSQQKLEATERDRLETFGQLKSVLEQQQQVTEHLRDSTDHLKNILSNNQQRGQYGEEVAEQLIQAVGFVRGENYLIHPKTKSGTQPDLALLMPDKTQVNVDVKFPIKALIHYQESQGEPEKAAALKQFSADVKQKVKEVTSRSYINPEEGTADFVILFVPNEMVFSFIYDKLRDVWMDALKQRVILAGPFNFVAILRTIYWSHQNFKYQENLRDIIGLIKSFEEEYQRFNQAVDKLGGDIDRVADQYRQVVQTRRQKLVHLIDQIKGEAKNSSGAEKQN